MTDTSNAPTSSPLVETPPQPNAVSTVNDLDLSQYAGSGFEDVKSTDLVLPFWKLLQSAGNETKKQEPEYIKGATEGMWLDTVSKRLYRDIVVIPCKMVTHYIEWRKRNEGGGLIKNHGTDRAILDLTHRDEKTGKDTLDNGHEVITTATWFVLVIEGKEINTAITDDPGSPVDLLTRAVITFQSTALKASRGWVSLAQAMKLRDPKTNLQYQPPMFAMSYQLGCVGTRNDAGSWVLPVIKQAGWTTDYPNASVLIKEANEYTKLANELHLMVITPQGSGDDDRPQRDSKANRYEDDRPRRQPMPGGPNPSGREEVDDDIPF
jgi:hypothetical protein